MFICRTYKPSIFKTTISPTYFPINLEIVLQFKKWNHNCNFLHKSYPLNINMPALEKEWFLMHLLEGGSAKDRIQILARNRQVHIGSHKNCDGMHMIGTNSSQIKSQGRRGELVPPAKQLLTFYCC